MTKTSVLILDYGSQYTQLIARRIRELGVYCLIWPGSVALSPIETLAPAAVILSGGPSSVDETAAPQLPQGFLAWQKQSLTPVLGICYGMQLLARDLGGTVEKSSSREYGKMAVFEQNGSHFSAWMSHGDHVKTMPPGFIATAKSKQGILASMFHPARRILALQFHPEVTHTENGSRFIRDFLFDVASLQADWNVTSVLEQQLHYIDEKVGPDDHVVCGLSGGVDSTVAAVLAHGVLGERLHCIFVDHGLLRLNEGNQVMAMFEKHLHLPVRRIDASKVFLRKLDGISDPEEKRKIIGAQFVATFHEQAVAIGSKLGKQPTFLLQGTLYPDVIESSVPNGSTTNTHSVTIKTHHNVGGLPKDMKFQLLEPLRELFKDEVRQLGAKLQIPTAFLNRHPFPGPGLAVRIIGEITASRIKILQEVDEIFIEAIRRADLYEKIWQAFAVFLPIKSVGVQGDGRSHDHVIALRAVTSTDGMTADWYPFEPAFLAEVSNQICNQVQGVNRVVYDISSKPPATIEWE